MLINNALVLGTYNRLNGAREGSNKTVEKLTSGKRINLARDDAAGLAIQESFKSQVRGLSQAARNTQDGISLMQTADAAAENVERELNRMKELAVEGANATVTDSDRHALDEEFQRLKDEIEGVAENSEFNCMKLLKEDKTLVIQTKEMPSEFKKVKLHKLDLDAIGLKDVSLSDEDSCNTAIDKMDEGLEKVLDVRLDFGCSLNSLKNSANSASTAQLSITNSLSKIQDADMAQSMMDYLKQNILENYTNSMVVFTNHDTRDAAKLLL